MLWLGQSWLVLLLDVSVKSLALATLAAVVMAIFRIRNTNVQHRVWSAVLLGMLALPLLVPVMPKVPIPAWLFPDFSGQPDELAPAFDAVRDNAFDGSVDASLADLGGISMDSTSALHELDASIEPTTLADIASDVHGMESSAGAAEKLQSASGGWWSQLELSLKASWPATICVTYFAFLVGFLCRVGVGLWGASCIVARSYRVELPQLLNNTNGRGHCSNLFESDELCVPLTVGFFRPKILLPADWRDWGQSKLAAVLAHESEHIRRGDYLIAVLAEFNRAIHWFNPLSWFLRRWLAELAEQNCDDAVIASTGERTLYARYLLEVARSLSVRQRGRVIWSGVAMAHKPNVETRIDAILDLQRPLARRIGIVRGLVLGAVAVPAVLIAAALRPSEPAPIEDTPVVLTEDFEGIDLAEAGGNESAAAISDSSADVEDGTKLHEAATAKLATKVLKKPETLANADSQPLVYEGQVLTSDGKPAAGAAIYHVYWYNTPLKSVPIQPVATTDAEGRFRFESKTPTVEGHAGGSIVAKLNGHAINWAMDVALESSGQLKAEYEKSPWYPRFKNSIVRDQAPIRLPSADASIRGRIVDLEGNGVPNAAVAIEGIYTGEDATLDAWEKLAATPEAATGTLQNAVPRSINGPMVPSLFAKVTTDNDGRFALRGIGKNRLVKLAIRGHNIEAMTVYAGTNGGPKRIIPFDFWTETYFGSEILLVAAPSKPVVGTIIDSKTGEPLAGAVLTSFVGYRQSVEGGKITHSRVGSNAVIAVTDAQGSYRLDGLPPAERSPIHISLEHANYLRREISVDTRGNDVEPVRQDLQLTQGVLVSGRVTDVKSGAGIAGSFKFLPAPQESPAEFSFHLEIGRSDQHGQFRVLIPHEKGNLCFQANNRFDYELKPTPEHQSSRLVVWALDQEFNAVHEIEPMNGQDAIDSLHLALHPLSRITGRAIAPDGTLLRDVLYVGRTTQHPRWWPSPNGDLEVIGLEKEKPRRLFVLHRQQKLAGSLVLKGDVADRFEAKLQPWATVKGRIVDEGGEPRGGVRLNSKSDKPLVLASPQMSMRDFSKYPLPLPPRDELGNANHVTDAHGRFELTGMTPGHEYNIAATLDGSPAVALRLEADVASKLTLNPGETCDLGTIVLKKQE